MNFYIADLHFGHKNIIKYDNRPFDTVEEMDQCLMDRWNNAVGDNDTVYILGDVSWYNRRIEEDIMSKLNGHKMLVIGNHDSGLVQNVYDAVAPMMFIKDGWDDVVLCHYPVMALPQVTNGKGIHLYGHTHTTSEWHDMLAYCGMYKRDYGRNYKAANVGCMMQYMNYTPRTLAEIKEALGW